MICLGLLSVLCLSSAPTIRSIDRIAGPLVTFHRVEYRVALSATYANGFDPDQVELVAQIISPSHKVLRISGFLYQEFERGVGPMTMSIPYASAEAVLKGAAREKRYPQGEILKPAAPSEWRVRFTPVESGTYSLTFLLRDKTGESRSKSASIKIGKGLASYGFVGRDRMNSRAFRLSTGQGFFPLGANIGWASERGTRDFDDDGIDLLISK